jgi:hypothetical protein
MPKSEVESLAPLAAALSDLMEWFRIMNIPGIVIGGVAASLLGRPRVTRDVDALVMLDEQRWSEFLDSGKQFNFFPRMADVLSFAQQSRVLLLTHQPSAIDIDISFGALIFEKECIDRAITIEAGGITLRLPSPEDLVIMKAVAHRTRDLIDIEAILQTHLQFNFAYVKKWLSEFATTLEMPEILEDVEAIFERLRKRKKS